MVKLTQCYLIRVDHLWKNWAISLNIIKPVHGSECNPQFFFQNIESLSFQCLWKSIIKINPGVLETISFKFVIFP